jgi:hypothetical protein
MNSMVAVSISHPARLDCGILNASGTTSVTIPNDRSRSAGIPNTNAQSWANLQTHYDTEVARGAMAGVIARIKRFESAQA